LRGVWDKLYGARGAFEPPRAVLVVSAHWEGSTPGKVEVLERPGPNAPLLFDYYGFPPETYEYTYNAPQDRALTDRVLELLRGAGIRAETNAGRKSFDHGVYIPLLLMRPQADVPILQVSLDASLDPEAHLALGRALAPLRDEGVLILGSGMTVHNMHERMPSDTAWAHEFQSWLDETVTNPNVADRQAMLRAWEKQGPHARRAHPREEHLLPILVTQAAAGAEPAERLWDGWMARTFPLNAFLWGGNAECESS